ncbi:MAG: hypothetical protein EB108_05535, partial [Actinobacteria bacterium]|nr:hypothetical protein [Actinomycetota bacterium]
HGVSAGTLGIAFGLANLISGVGAVATGRRLDVFGPRAVLGIVGPFGAVLYGASSFFTGTTFLVTYALGGGLIGAAGFYSFTQPLAVRVAKTDAARAITRLTIWGAFSSPIMIPFTEILRANFGWQIAVRLPAALTAIAFLVAAAMCRVDVVAGEKLSSSLFKSLRGALSDVRLRLFAAAAFFSSVAVSTLLVYQVPTMTWAGASAGTAALFASLRGLMQLAGRIPLLAAINRYTASKLIVIARVLLGVSALFLLLSGNVVMALIYIVLAGVTIGGIGLVATLGGSLGPIFAGWLRDIFDSPVAPMLIVLLAACSAATIFAIQQSIARMNPATQ